MVFMRNYETGDRLTWIEAEKSWKSIDCSAIRNIDERFNSEKIINQEAPRATKERKNQIRGK